MSNKLLKLAIGASTVLGSAIAIGGGTPAFADPAGTPADGSVTLGVLSGNSDTSVSLTPNPAPANCDGDSATGGYRWQGFMVPASYDVATVTYNSGGPVVQNAGDVAVPIVSGGAAQINRTTAVSTGQILPLMTDFRLAYYPAGFITPGEYKLGYACTNGGQTTNHWFTTMTITADATNGGSTGLVWAQGAIASAPTLDSVSAGDGEVTANFTPAADDPASTSFEVTATDGTNTFTQSGAASPITVTGLTNGVTYDVSVTATNAVGTSAASNVIQATPALPSLPGVNGLNVTVIPGGVTIGWTAPTGATPTGYEVNLNPAQAGDPQLVNDTTFSYTYNGLTAGDVFTATVTPVYPANPGVPTTSASFTIPGDAIIYQELNVTVPPGALILTQRCGVNSAHPAVSATAAFPHDIPAVAASVATGAAGEAPFLNWADINNGTNPDPEFANYPAPNPSSQTHCGLDMSNARLITGQDSPALAGKFRTSHGVLNQVTVLDTRYDDAGWTVNGTMEDFSNFGLSGANTSFAGDQLGWTPVVTQTSTGQTVVAGAAVVPGTANGLGDGEVLASAAAGAGIGEAVLDARVTLLIPTTVRPGDYTGTLTLSAL